MQMLNKIDHAMATSGRPSCRNPSIQTDKCPALYPDLRTSRVRKE
jgi:hypothetical protein